MSASTTLAPSCAKASAQALPMPCAAPVTSATRPASLPDFLLGLFIVFSPDSLAQDERIGRLPAGIDPDRFGLQIGVDRFLAAFAPDAAAFVAAEGRHVADGAIAVYPDSAGLQPVRHADGPADVRGPYAGGKP